MGRWAVDIEIEKQCKSKSGAEEREAEEEKCVFFIRRGRLKERVIMMD